MRTARPCTRARHERGQHIFCEPTCGIVTPLKTWRREHSDGSHGFVEQLETGTFLVVDFVLVSEGLRTGVSKGEFCGLENACQEWAQTKQPHEVVRRTHQTATPRRQRRSSEKRRKTGTRLAQIPATDATN